MYIRKELSDLLFFSLRLYYHERFHRCKQRIVYKLESRSFDNSTIKFKFRACFWENHAFYLFYQELNYYGHINSLLVISYR